MMDRVGAPEQGFEPAAFEQLASVEEGSFWFRSRNRLISWALSHYFPAARSLLDVGCGTGYVLAGLRESMPELRLVGGELYPEALEIAQRRLPGVELMQLDARELPFEAEFDAAGAFDVIEHIDQDQAALDSIARAVRPGGGVLLTVPQHRWLWSANDEYGHHRRRYRRGELVAKARAAGLDVLRTTSFVSLLLPAMFVSRLRQRGPIESFDPMTEYRCSPGLNALLERVLGLELALIRRGVSLPAGGTLLVVARRR